MDEWGVIREDRNESVRGKHSVDCGYDERE